MKNVWTAAVHVEEVVGGGCVSVWLRGDKVALWIKGIIG